MSNVTCRLDECNNAVQAKGLCSGHYNRTYYPDRHASVKTTCSACGVAVMKPASNNKARRPACSDRCRYYITHGFFQEDKPAKTPRPPGPRVDKGRPNRSMWSPLRLALDTGDRVGVLKALKSRTEEQPNGCWEWTGKLDKSGYPQTAIAGRHLSPYRASLEAFTGKTLGKQAAHHKCANPKCINPSHLEAVTHAANSAEMMARTYMTSRIVELEDALRIVDPDNELLLEISVLRSDPSPPTP